jgi:CheY-like chemotaxis protein
MMTDALKPLSDISVLIVEDEPLVALDLHDTLRKAGASIIASTTIEDALKLISYADITVALLDINLSGTNCSTACEALELRSIPFIFHTAHVPDQIKQAWPFVPVIMKPADNDRIVSMLSDLVESKNSRPSVWP